MSDKAASVPVDTPKNIVIVGAAGFGRECLDVILAMRTTEPTLEIVGVVDDAPSEEDVKRLSQQNVEHLGTLASWFSETPNEYEFLIGIGNTSIRKRITQVLEAAGVSPFTAIHPTASIGSNTSISAGTVVCAGAVISNNVVLGRHTHINPNATIGHDAVLENYTSVNPAAVVSGGVLVGEGSVVGANATILQQLHVGEHVTIGAGSVVTRDVPAGVTVVGIPGRWNA